MNLADLHPYITMTAIYAVSETILSQCLEKGDVWFRVTARLLGIVGCYVYININSIRLTDFDRCVIGMFWCLILLSALFDVLDAWGDERKARYTEEAMIRKQNAERMVIQPKEGEWRAGYYEMCGFGRVVK